MSNQVYSNFYDRYDDGDYATVAYVDSQISNVNATIDTKTEQIYGYMYIDLYNTSATTINTVNLPEKVNCITAAGDLNKFTHTNNRLTYTGTVTKKFKIDCNTVIGYSTGAATTNASIVLYKNGSITVGNQIYTQMTRATTTNPLDIVRSLSTSAIITLEQNDYVELYIANNSSLDNLICQSMNMSVCNF